jgi:hypothetical protein
MFLISSFETNNISNNTGKVCPSGLEYNTARILFKSSKCRLVRIKQMIHLLGKMGTPSISMLYFAH